MGLLASSSQYPYWDSNSGLSPFSGDSDALITINEELGCVAGWGDNTTDYCYWEGEIPRELEVLENFQEFQISSNRLNGSVPHWVGHLTNLRVFTAYENHIVGRIPDKLGSVSQLELLNLHSNQLDGPIPKSIFAMGKLQVLVLTQNGLTGELPREIGDCGGLSSVRIGNNKLVGTIPKTIGNGGSLTYFEADNNNLSGEIVSEFASCTNLTLLNLAYNGFTGIFPPEIGQLMNLQELILSGNSLFGDIPRSILGCKNLNMFDLSSNQFNGTGPKKICNMTRLQYLLLDQNLIKGEIPREIGNCVKLLELQLSSNLLTGIIPPDIGHIRNMQIALNLSFNRLHGQLPTDLGKLDNLVSLDVSSNQLTSDIPLAFKGTLSLIEVKISNNFLVGPIPVFVPFQKSPSSSFQGNKGLCGEPLSLSCADSIGSDQAGDHHRVPYRTILAVIGSGLALFVSVSVMVLLFMMKERQEKAAKGEDIVDEETSSQPTIIAGNMFLENLRQAVDLDAVVKATLKDSNKINNGSFRTIYKAIMPSGLILAVKRLKSMDRIIIHHQNKMIRELERLSKLCHDNLVQPIGFVIYEDVALLLHQYLPNGTLAQLLHQTSKQSDYQPDWPRRLPIAIGVAQGLAFLHHVAVIHLDISSYNVLLDAEFKPFVGEIEISKLLDPSEGTASISAVAGSFGYIPPDPHHPIGSRRGVWRRSGLGEMGSRSLSERGNPGADTGCEAQHCFLRVEERNACSFEGGFTLHRHHTRQSTQDEEGSGNASRNKAKVMENDRCLLSGSFMDFNELHCGENCLKNRTRILGGAQTRSIKYDFHCV
ncbi:Leucine-rich repeat receptor-like tyrosine-protein kinase PXC3 [Hibiscus syriacus]|uniref:Leucine-rich repeat receptor-like tyrosine-protein kinase PXC3 n=1 Tax=Hibiscus syriacus TaxID=106335 RepID=A0A6A3CEZ4_HIBSY|nr:Leucine-rich repeat receptor-like tyrosine-protein kinase PXC3 [Hibiscus syriacus]